MLFKLLHTKQLNTALKTATSSRSRSIFSSNSWWEMCSSGNRTGSVRPGGKYRSIQHTKISEIQTGIFGQMERARNFHRARALLPAGVEFFCLASWCASLSSLTFSSRLVCFLVEFWTVLPCFFMFTNTIAYAFRC